MFSFVQRALASGLDMFSRGNGFVREQIENDQALQTAIAAEGVNFIALLNNKVKIISLLFADVASGKMTQQLKSPQIIEILKNDNDPSIFSGPAPGQSETGSMPSGGETAWNQVQQQAQRDDNMCKTGAWEDSVDSQCTTGPDITEI